MISCFYFKPFRIPLGKKRYGYRFILRTNKLNYRSMRTLILLSAIPGSGKSTWAKKYQEEHQNTYIVASDSIRKELFGSEDCFKDENLVWETFRNRLNEHVEEMDDLTVIADATHLSNRLRKMYYELTPKFDKHVLVVFDIPFEISLYQNSLRTRKVPVEAMYRLKKEYEIPSKEIEELYDEIIYVRDFISPEAKKLGK